MRQLARRIVYIAAVVMRAARGMLRGMPAEAPRLQGPQANLVTNDPHTVEAPKFLNLNSAP